MTAADVLRRLATVIDEHRWSDLPGLLHRDFRCRLVHTGETFDRESWVRFNADYPGFVHFELQDCIADHDRAAGRSHVTGQTGGVVQHFEVASFLTVRDGLVVELVEVWSDVEAVPPTRTGPA
ncbi:MAG TPA: nuclear transport factor 2 family protein [Microlunatus sp.]|nr:nuclear transport factor 2 family protein [Microlunatus sp.]